MHFCMAFSSRPQIHLPQLSVERSRALSSLERLGNGTLELLELFGGTEGGILEFDSQRDPCFRNCLEVHLQKMVDMKKLVRDFFCAFET